MFTQIQPGPSPTTLRDRLPAFRRSILNVSRLPHRRNTLLSALAAFLLITGCSSVSTNGGGSGGSGGSGGGGSQASVTVSGASQVRLGSTTSFTATVVNLANTAVTWQVGGIAGGNSSVGTINAAGVYTPPANLPATNPVTVTAVSVASPSTSGSAQVSIFNPVPVITSAVATLVSGTNYALNVAGSSFVDGAQIQVGGIDVNTIWVSSTNLQATIGLPNGTMAPSIGVVIRTPAARLRTQLRQRFTLPRFLRRHDCSIRRPLAPRSAIFKMSRMLESTPTSPTSSTRSTRRCRIYLPLCPRYA